MQMYTYSTLAVLCIEAHLMFLSLSSLLLQLLLFLQFLRDPGLPHRLLLHSLVRLEVERCFKRGGSTTARDDLSSELLLKLEQSQSSQLYHGSTSHHVREGVWKLLKFMDTVKDTRLDPVHETK